MVAVTQNVDDEVFSEEGKVITVTIVGNPDLTGRTYKADFRIARSHPDVVLSYASGTGIDLLSQAGPPTKGQLTITIPPADALKLKNGTYYYGVARTDGGIFDVEAEGSYRVRRSAVRQA
jgi:hypothetical protein